MFIDRWMDKEVVVYIHIYVYIHTYIYIHTRISLSHKKEQIWVNCSKVDEPRLCYVEWSKSEREKLVLYINAYTWNLEKYTDEPIFRAGMEMFHRE